MLRIVVVEDEVKTLDAISALIGKLSPSYAVVGKAQNGREGIEAVAALHPHVVITDIRMPEMDGLSMIRCLREKGVCCQFIILSGYADFEFAREAIKLTSVAYLLKPVTVSDLRATLETAEENISRADAGSIPVLESYPLSNILRRAASESEAAHAPFLGELKRRLGGCTLALLLLHSDHSRAESEKAVLAAATESARFSQHVGTCCIVDFDAENEQLLLVAGKNPQALERYVLHIWESCRGSINEQTVFCHEQLADAAAFPETFREMREIATWGISYPAHTLLCRKLILQTKFKKLEYPLSIERSLFQKISSGELDGVEQDMERLIWWLTRESYNCADLRETMLSLLSAILYAIRKVSYSVYAEVCQIEIDNAIRRANSVQAYIHMLTNVINQFRYYNRGIGDCRNPAVHNVLRIIEAEYNQNISLESIAGRINLTTEYLSTLFKKEIGVRFTVYLTQYRIERAKELIARQDTKIYSAARQVGYNDTTYFCKVFRRVTGQSPKDYMNSVS